MFSLKPDYKRTRERMQAFWERQVLDRPLVQFRLPKPANEQQPWPVSRDITSAERWLDAQFQAETALVELSNQDFLGDSLPVAWPNLGPEILSALYGCPLHFGDYGTSWSEPVLHDWADADQIQLDWSHPLLLKLHEMTDALLEIGKDRFMVGMTDWHPGGDCIAALRDPASLAVDLLANPGEVKKLLRRITGDYFKLYDQFYEKLRKAGQPLTCWTSLVDDGRYYIPSCDFSIMISKKMFDEFFLPGIIEECRFLDRSIYHLDGPGALRHLDSILSIAELDALQFVPGAGNEVYARWVQVYQEAQRRGKAVQVSCRFTELEQVMDTLSPRGLYLSVEGVPDREAAEQMLQVLERWTAEKRRLGQA